MNNGTATVPSSAGGMMERVSPCVINPFRSEDLTWQTTQYVQRDGSLRFVFMCCVVRMHRIRLKYAPYIHMLSRLWLKINQMAEKRQDMYHFRDIDQGYNSLFMFTRV